MSQSKIPMEDKKSGKRIRPIFTYGCSICQEISRTTYFLKLQKVVWLGKLYFYTKMYFIKACKGFH